MTPQPDRQQIERLILAIKQAESNYHARPTPTNADTWQAANTALHNVQMQMLRALVGEEI